MITIYHNNRCRKSREGLQILEESGKEFQIIKYLEEVPTKEELKEVIAKLGISAIDLIRKNELVWKENYKGKDLTEEEVIDAMIKYPKLIERPIVINNNTAVIGRPPSVILDIL